MPRGGIRKGAGRKAVLATSEREEIRREYRDKTQAWAAAVAYNRDPIVRKNLKLDEKIGKKISRFRSGNDGANPLDQYGSIPPQDIPALRVEREKAGIPNLTKLPLDTRVRGPRKRFIRELATKHHISERMVKTCLDE